MLPEANTVMSYFIKLIYLSSRFLCLLRRSQETVHEVGFCFMIISSGWKMMHWFESSGIWDANVGYTIGFVLLEDIGIPLQSSFNNLINSKSPANEPKSFDCLSNFHANFNEFDTWEIFKEIRLQFVFIAIAVNSPYKATQVRNKHT